MAGDLATSASRKNGPVSAGAARKRSVKRLLVVGLPILVLLIVIQVPKTVKGLGRGPAEPASSPSATVAKVVVLTATSAVQAAPSATVLVGANRSLESAQLARFATKDPFVPQRGRAVRGGDLPSPATATSAIRAVGSAAESDGAATPMASAQSGSSDVLPKNTPPPQSSGRSSPPPQNKS